jgi:hypothetical protein
VADMSLLPRLVIRRKRILVSSAGPRLRA